MIHAALYARVSSTRQKQHETIDSQVACLHEHAQEQGWEIPAEWVFTDDGWSGSALVRPALERLRDLSTQRLVERVVCLSPDRLARNYGHQVLLIEEFTKNGTDLVFIHNPVATTAEESLMVQFQGMIAEYERAQISERTRRGKLHRARNGETSLLGRAPYGYRYLSRAEHRTAAYAVVEAEARVVARIFHRYAAGGISMQALARELSKDQIPSPQGNPQWDAGTLGRMLRNPAYVGRACFGKSRTVPDAPRPNRTSRLAGRGISPQAGVTATPREEWIEVPGPALVSEELFILVERRLAENAKFSPRNTKVPVLLQGLLICDVCGYAYSRTSQGPGPKKYRYYRCPGTNGWELPGAIKICTSRPLRADDLEELVWQHVHTLLSDPELVRAELERRLARMRDAAPFQARKERLHQEIAVLDAAIARLVGAYQEELVTLDELRERVPRLRSQRQILHNHLKSLAAQLVDQQAYLKLAENLEGFLDRLRESARTASVLERQRILRAVVKEVRVGPDRITIRHSIPSTTSDPTPGYLLQRGRPRDRDLRRQANQRHHRRGHRRLQRGQPGAARHPCPPQEASPAARVAPVRRRLHLRRRHGRRRPPPPRHLVGPLPSSTSL
ncbi:recombinase family protein [Streptomyces sp. NBC_00079]|uniref:recombinase family protein n=2 Tax=Streptomyces TaxID=1883 RepID=UPI00324C64B1